MLDNVFDSKEILNYIFSIDYIYNFLQIKLICNEDTGNKLDITEESEKHINQLEENNKKIKKKFNSKIKNNEFFFDDEYKKMFQSQEHSISLVKLGVDYKKKQKIKCFRNFDYDFQDNIFCNSLQEKNNESYPELCNYLLSLFD